MKQHCWRESCFALAPGAFAAVTMGVALKIRGRAVFAGSCNWTYLAWHQPQALGGAKGAQGERLLHSLLLQLRRQRRALLPLLLLLCG